MVNSKQQMLNSLLSRKYIFYRVGDEVADDLLDSVDVDGEDQSPLRRERFIRNHIQAALLIYEGQAMKSR